MLFRGAWCGSMSPLRAVFLWIRSVVAARSGMDHQNTDLQSWDALAGIASGASTPFDYDAIDERLKERPELTASERESEAALPMEVAQGFSAVLGLVVDQVMPQAPRPIDLRTVGAKLVALLYLANPQAFHGESMKKLAERSGISRQALAVHLREHNDRYGFVGSWQHTPKARAAFAAAQARFQDRRRALEKLAERHAHEAEHFRGV